MRQPRWKDLQQCLTRSELHVNHYLLAGVFIYNFLIATLRQLRSTNFTYYKAEGLNKLLKVTQLDKYNRTRTQAWASEIPKNKITEHKTGGKFLTSPLTAPSLWQRYPLKTTALLVAGWGQAKNQSRSCHHVTDGSRAGGSPLASLGRDEAKPNWEQSGQRCLHRPGSKETQVPGRALSLGTHPIACVHKCKR